MYDLIILGSGPAGYTAAIYAARGNLKTLVLRGSQPGGQLTTTTVIENWPGFENGIDGNQLMQEMEKQAKRFGAELVTEVATAVDFSQSPYKVMVGEKVYEAKTIILATGAKARMTGAAGEEKLFAKGISTCATCDGFFYKDKDVIVLGGGDTAMEEATFLTNFCKSVTVVHRRDEFRASKIMAEHVLNNPKIEVVWDSVVESFNGEEKLESVTLKNRKTEEVTDRKADGVFLAIGHMPNTELYKDQVELLDTGYIKSFGNMKTSVEGVYYSGDCEDSTYRQAIVAAGSGSMAAIEAMRYLEQQD